MRVECCHSLRVVATSTRFWAWLALPCASWTASPAVAQHVEPHRESPADAELLLPRSGAGTWLTQVQLVWNGAAARLERRRYELFDPFAARAYDLFWEPRDVAADAAGPVAGQGVLTWRTAGALRYDGKAIVAQYRGAMRGGRPDGAGSFVHRDGVRYDGEWSMGLMQGRGHLSLPNGDAYLGEFRAGRPDGEGRYIASTGAIYEGGFFEGLKHGPAFVAEPNGFRFSSRWDRGREETGGRADAPSDWPTPTMVQATVESAPGLAVSTRVADVASFCCQPDSAGAVPYTAVAYPDRLEVLPDMPTVLAIWRGAQNIVVQNKDAFDDEREMLDEYAFRGLGSADTNPVKMIFGLENSEQRVLSINGAYIEVASSVLDAEPLLQSIELEPAESQSLKYSIENYGWAAAEGAKLNGRLKRPDRDGEFSEPFEIILGDLNSVQDFSFESMLQKFGVRTSELSKYKEICPEKNLNAKKCIEMVKSRKDFGRLPDYVSEANGQFGVWVDGTLSFQWRGLGGVIRSRTSPFNGFVPLGSIQSQKEGEGGDTVDLSDGVREPFELTVGKTDYRVPLPIAGSAPAGAISRWALALSAQKSSKHSFRFVFEMADGKVVRSREIRLSFLKPRVFDKSIRPDLKHE